MNKADLEAAARAGFLQQSQVGPLAQFLDELHRDQPRFDFTHLLYYFGGLTAIGAMTLFMNLGWEQFGGWGIVSICLAYAAVGLLLTEWLLARGFKIPAGICATFVVCLAPLGVYGMQLATGYWPDSSEYRLLYREVTIRFLYIELGSLLAAALVLYRYRLPFLMMPVATALWYLSQDICEVFFQPGFTTSQSGYVSMAFGFAMVVFAFVLELRSESRRDYSFWLYLFGVAAFWGGLSIQNSDSELAKLGYFAINLTLIFTGIVIARKVFVVFGGLGCAAYFAHLAIDVFQESWLFPVVLSLLGLCIVGLGILWQKHEQGLTKRLRSWLPAGMERYLENRLV